MKDILTEFDQLLRSSGDDGMTTSELAQKKGCSDITARRAIKKKIEDGTIAFAGRKRMTDISGRSLLVPAYKLVKAKKSPTAKARS